MEIHQIPEKDFKWPKPEELKKKATQGYLSSNELLALKSRSFYLPIWMLQLVRGNQETNKKAIVTNLYNILRQQDTIEDADPDKLNQQTRIDLIDEFTRIIDQLCRRSPTESIDDLVQGSPDSPGIPGRLAKLTEILKTGVMDDEERIFVEHFGKGRVLENIKEYETLGVKEAISGCVSKMAIGMKSFIRDGKINTLKDLDEYCGYVAGDVGIALNKIIEHDDGFQLDNDMARIFGLALQKVNVMKNIREDWVKRSVVYLPREYLGDISNEELFDVTNSNGENARKTSLEVMLKNARAGLNTAAGYIMAIPEPLTGYQAFTMIPLFAAAETLLEIDKAGADEVFSREVKMKPEAFMKIGMFVYSLAILENGRKVKEFVRSYKEAQENEDYNKFSFSNGGFKEWSKRLFAD